MVAQQLTSADPANPTQIPTAACWNPRLARSVEAIMGIRVSSQVSLAVFAMALATGMLAGCDDAERKSSSAPSGGPAVSASPSVSSSPETPVSPPGAGAPGGGEAGGGPVPGNPAPPASPGPAEPAEITLTGDVMAGVEPGCIVLKASNQTFLLVGGDRARLDRGGKITVRGRTDPGLMTTCQQGTPLRVLELRTP